MTTVFIRIDWPCWLRHDWGQWGEPRRFGHEIYQSARCRKCGKQKQRSCGWAVDYP